MTRLTHLDDKGAARMVDVSAKDDTARAATAQSIVAMSPEAFAAVMDGTAPKGDVLAAARIAGIMAAKKVPELIPLCHPLPITAAEVNFEAGDNRITITAMVTTVGKTGVEMEALTAASIAALTIYDMIKAVDKSAVIESTRLLAKSGGKSGTYLSAPKEAVRRSAPAQESVRETVQRGARATPKVIMGEVFAPRSASGPDARREAFRAFMTRHRLRATAWARDAGVPVGEVMGYLIGKSRGFSQPTLEKLAKAAKVAPEEMFQ